MPPADATHFEARMKDNPEINDEAMKKLLRETRREEPLPPGFQASVWHRIDRLDSKATGSIWQDICHWMGTQLPRPRVAIPYFSVLLAIGISLGLTQGQKQAGHLKNTLSERYVRGLNPYQAPR